MKFDIVQTKTCKKELPRNRIRTEHSKKKPAETRYVRKSTTCHYRKVRAGSLLWPLANSVICCAVAGLSNPALPLPNLSDSFNHLFLYHFQSFLVILLSP